MPLQERSSEAHNPVATRCARYAPGSDIRCNRAATPGPVARGQRLLSASPLFVYHMVSFGFDSRRFRGILWEEKTGNRQTLILTSPALLPHFFPDSLLSKLSRTADWSVTHEREDTLELRARLDTSDALLTTWHSPFLRLTMLGSPPRVKLIAHAGGEIRSRMQDEVVRTITVTNAPGAMAKPVAEMALAMVLTLLRRLPEYGREMESGLILPNSEAPEGETLFGKRIGLIGFGRIGQAFARLVRPFDVDLVVDDPYCPAEILQKHRCRAATTDQILKESPVIVLTAALTAETRGLLDRRRLGLLQDGACLVNVARGGLIQTDALVEALKGGSFPGRPGRDRSAGTASRRSPLEIDAKRAAHASCCGGRRRGAPGHGR